MADPLAQRLAGTVTLEQAALLGFGGWLARNLGRADPRPEGTRLKHRLVDGELREAAVGLTRALDTAGLPHVVARGVALLGSCYQPGDRATVDVDCYVPAARRQDVLGVLGGLGYALDGDPGAPVGMERGCTCTRPGGVPVTVDLHWGLPRADRLITYGEPQALDPVWSDTQLLDGVRVPGRGTHLALVLHHLVHHDLLHARGLVDALLLWRTLNDDDRARLAELAARWRIRRVAEGLAMVAGGPTYGDAAGAASELAPEVLLPRVLVSDPREAETVSPRRVRRRLALLDRRRDFVRLLRDIVFPPAAYLRWRWPGRSAMGAWWQHVRRQARRVMFPG